MKDTFDKSGGLKSELGAEEDVFVRAYRNFGALRVKDIVWGVYSQETGDKYFVKRATPGEIEMTERASAFELPEDSNLVLPHMLDTGEIFSEISADDFPVSGRDPHHTDLLVTKGHPLPFLYRDFIPPTLGNLTQEQWQGEDGFPLPLRGQPMTNAELALLRRDVTSLNEAGIFNHDFGSNLFVQREEDGMLKFYAIDFEPHVFNATAPEGVFEDVDHLDSLFGRLRAKAPELFADDETGPNVGFLPGF